MRISDAELDFWGNLYCEHDLRRYLRFSVFIHNPTAHIHRIFGGECRPLLARQVAVRQEMERLGRHDLVERLEARGELSPQAMQPTYRYDPYRHPGGAKWPHKR